MDYIVRGKEKFVQNLTSTITATKNTHRSKTDYYINVGEFKELYFGLTAKR